MVLHDQGLPGPGQTDLILAATPVLVAVPVVLVVLRLYPLAVRALLAVAARASGATGFVALAQASRNAAGGVLPVFAVVLALSVAASAGMIRDAVSRGENAAAWAATGADVVITNRPGLSPPAYDHVTARRRGPDRGRARSPADRRGLGDELERPRRPGRHRAGRRPGPVRRADQRRPRFRPSPPASWARRRAAEPSPPRASTIIPVVASPAAAAFLGRPGGPAGMGGPATVRLTTRQQGLGPIRVRVTGLLRSTPAQPSGGEPG